MKFWKLAIAALAIAFAAPNIAQARNTLRLLAPFPPGSTTDEISRVIAQELSKKLHRDIVVLNRTGAYGILASRELASSSPDGNTLGVLADGMMATLPASCEAHGSPMPYDPMKFEPIGFIARGYLELVVRSELPFNTFAQLIVYARKHPGKLNFMGASPSNILGDGMLNEIDGVKIQEIPAGRGGEQQSILDILSKNADGMFSTSLTIDQYLRNGTLKTLGTFGSVPNPFVKGSQTIASQGYPVFANSDVWWALIAPPGLPEKMVKSFNAALTASLSEPRVKKQLAQIFTTPEPSTPEAVFAKTRVQLAFTAKIIKKYNLNVPCGN